MKERINPLKLWLAVAIAIMAISCASIFVRLADAPPLAIAMYRVLIALLVMFPFFKACQRKNFPTKKEIGLVVLAGVFLAFHFAFWITSLYYTSIASSVSLVNTSPIFVALFSHLFLREKSTLWGWLGIAIGIAGSLAFAGVDVRISKNHLYGDFLALLGALSISFYLIIGRRLMASMEAVVYIFYVYLAAFVVLLLFCFAFSISFWKLSERTLLIILLIGLIPQFIGHSLINWSLKYFPAYMVSLFTLGEPVGATILAAIFLKEYPEVSKIFSLFLIATGILISGFGERLKGLTAKA